MLAARFVTVGADTYWAVAMGRAIVRTGGVPDGIPFAAAPSTGWPNAPVLAELALAALAAPGPIGIVVAQLVVNAVALVLLASGARRLGTGDGPTAATLALMSVGALPALGSVKLQLFSVALFPLLLILLRREHDRPSRAVWWVLPLLALWGNLHGAVLLGVGVTGAYLAFSRLRMRPLETVVVGLVCLLALFANPALGRTLTYYAGLLGNEAARRGTELWARPNPSSLFDLLLIVAGIVLVAAALWARPPLWEVVAILGLVVGTATSARHGVWLLMLCVAPAARRFTHTREVPSPTSTSRHGIAVAATVAVIGSGLLLASRLDSLNPSGRPAIVAAVRQAAGDTVVLADEPLAESLAAEGVRVWMSNPLDAFAQADQAAYLDFVSGAAGNSTRALDASDVVVVRSGGGPDALVTRDARFAPVGQVEGYLIYGRAGGGRGS